jgi:hypothetical protein
MSYPFTFEKQPIEYCIGMEYYNNLLYISYSLKDNNTKVVTIDPNRIELFEDVEK